MLDKVVIVLLNALTAAGFVWAVNRWAMFRLRPAQGSHWTERARLLYPVRASAMMYVWAVPCILVVAEKLLWDEEAPPWGISALISVVAVFAVNQFVDYEIFFNRPLKKLVGQSAIGWSMRFLIWFVFVGVAVSMPSNFRRTTWCLFGGVIILYLFWWRCGFVLLWKGLRLILPASERLLKITDATSSAANIGYHQVLILRSPLATAFALQGSRSLLFSERLLEILLDEEVAVVCAHELGHLSETKSIRCLRFTGLIAYLPWLLCRPLVQEFGGITIFILVFLTYLLPGISQILSRKMEVRADKIAKDNESDAGVYAKALYKIYQDGLIPAVSPTDKRTHPHLYDRLVKAGLTPDFNRPSNPEKLTLIGYFVSWTVGILFMMLLLQTFN